MQINKTLNIKLSEISQSPKSSGKPLISIKLLNTKIYKALKFTVTSYNPLAAIILRLNPLLCHRDKQGAVRVVCSN